MLGFKCLNAKHNNYFQSVLMETDILLSFPCAINCILWGYNYIFDMKVRYCKVTMSFRGALDENVIYRGALRQKSLGTPVIHLVTVVWK